MKLDNILPGWVKLPGKSSHAVFNVVQKPQSTRFEDIVIDGGGVSIKGSLEVDQNGDLINANFPTYSPSEGDKTSLKADRGADGVMKVTMRGDVFDGRGFLKSAISGKETDRQEQDQEHRFRRRPEARRGGRLLRRGAAQRRLQDVAAQRHDQELHAERQARTRHAADRRTCAAAPQGRDVIYLETNDAGAFFRFTDTYSKVVGGQLAAGDGSADRRTQRARKG